LPLEARRLREADGSSGTTSFVVIATLATVFAVLFDKYYYVPKYPEAMLDERLVLAAGAGAGFALVCALVNRTFKLGFLSRLAEQVIFVLIPPLALIFLVLGTSSWAGRRPPRAAPWEPRARW
jgi:TRAP-type mannitol/chloroaromatic compound transport system permease large subunit